MSNNLQTRQQAANFGIILAVVSAFAVRAFWIDHPALWTDEIFTLLYARNDIAHLLSLTRTSDIHPPLYYILVKGVAAVFGEGDGTALRAISASASAVSAGILFLFARYRFGIGVAVVATLFFVLLPVNVHYGRELRTYASLALALLSATVCFAEMMEVDRDSRAKSRFAIGYVLSLAVAFHLHYSAVVYFVLFGVAALALRVMDSDSSKLRFALGATLVAGILCLPQSVHFVLARNHVADDFWIEATTWRRFYGISLGAYPFPSWAKLIVYPMYLVGACLLWRRDRRLAVIAFTIMAGGPVLVASIGLFSPAYLVRTIQAFAALSPFLLALSILALPRVTVLPSISVLVAIHILTIKADYPSQKKSLAIDQIAPLVERDEPEVVYFFSKLAEQIELRQMKLKGWTPVSLEETGTLDLIAARLELCANDSVCGPTVVVMERAPRFQTEDGRSWMAGMDMLAARHKAELDTDIRGMRVLIMQ